MQVHANGHASIAVDVIVRRRIEEKAFKGLGVEFVDVNSATKDALMSLLRPISSEQDAIFVDDDDPGLH